MFEKSEERVEWLKKRMNIVDIEEQYIQTNGIKIVKDNVLMVCNDNGVPRVNDGWITEACLHGECKDCKREFLNER